MFYVVVKNKYEVGVYPEPTKERADNLAHCMGGFWRYKVIGNFEANPDEPGFDLLDQLAKNCPKYNRNFDIVTIYNNGMNRDEAQRFYCIPKALNWRKGMPKCL